MRFGVTFLILAFGLFIVVGCDEPRSNDEPRQDNTVWQDYDNTTVDETTYVEVEPRTHTVVKGETLYSIARMYYMGDEKRWKDIWEANKDCVPNKNFLKVGTVLIIPD
jgi:nucleoid-associated protein YgaU